MPSIPSLRTPAALLIALSLAAGVAIAAPPAPSSLAPRHALHDVQWEALPPAHDNGRFRLRAQLEPAPVPLTKLDAGAVRLRATLIPKAAAAYCPLPGSVFFDGFETF